MEHTSLASLLHQVSGHVLELLHPAVPEEVERQKRCSGGLVSAQAQGLLVSKLHRHIIAQDITPIIHIEEIRHRSRPRYLNETL